jgi:hypothetical protein
MRWALPLAGLRHHATRPGYIAKGGATAFNFISNGITCNMYRQLQG